MLSTIIYGLLIILGLSCDGRRGIDGGPAPDPFIRPPTHNATTGTIYAALYVMFGVSVGFSLFLVWQQFNTARQVTQNEAASVERLYRLAQRFPEPERDRVQDKAVSYARGVVEEEWPSMRRSVKPARRKATGGTAARRAGVRAPHRRPGGALQRSVGGVGRTRRE